MCSKEDGLRLSVEERVVNACFVFTGILRLGIFFNVGSLLLEGYYSGHPQPVYTPDT